MKAILKIFWQNQICQKIIKTFFFDVKFKKIAVSLIFHLAQLHYN